MLHEAHLFATRVVGTYISKSFLAKNLPRVSELEQIVLQMAC